MGEAHPATVSELLQGLPSVRSSEAVLVPFPAAVPTLDATAADAFAVGEQLIEAFWNLHPINTAGTWLSTAASWAVAPQAPDRPLRGRSLLTLAPATAHMTVLSPGMYVPDSWDVGMSSSGPYWPSMDAQHLIRRTPAALMLCLRNVESNMVKLCMHLDTMDARTAELVKSQQVLQQAHERIAGPMATLSDPTISLDDLRTICAVVREVGELFHKHVELVAGVQAREAAGQNL